MRVTMDIEAKDSGKVCIPAKILLDSLKNIAEQPLTFNIDKNFGVEITSDDGKYKVMGENPDNFPKEPAADDANNFTMTSTALVTAINKAIFAVSNDDLRPAMTGVFFELDKKDHKTLATTFNAIRKDVPEFSEQFLRFVLELHKSDEIDLTPEADARISSVVDKKVKDDLSVYYDLMDMIQDKGYVAEEVQIAVKDFYDKHEGLSLVNECVRSTIFDCFVRYINNLQKIAYTDFFEISKHFQNHLQPS